MLKDVIDEAIMNINLESIDFCSTIYKAVHPVATQYKPAEIYRMLHKDLEPDEFIEFVLDIRGYQTTQIQFSIYLYRHLVALYDDIYTIGYHDLNAPREVKHQMTLIRMAAENLSYAEFLRFRGKAPAKFKPLFDKVVGEIRCGQN